MSFFKRLIRKHYFIREYISCYKVEIFDESTLPNLLYDPVNIVCIEEY